MHEDPKPNQDETAEATTPPADAVDPTQDAPAENAS